MIARNTAMILRISKTFQRKPQTDSPGVVTIIDNTTTIYAFPGGSTSLSNLVPFTIPIGAFSVSGAWKITTGVNLSAVCGLATVIASVSAGWRYGTVWILLGGTWNDSGSWHDSAVWID